VNILISNDDGVYAEGIISLDECLSQSYKTTVVAPLEERSTTGHTLSLEHPLRIKKISENRYGCSGYPADCSLIGFAQIMKRKPDVIVSGINRGANLGQDVYYSGTMAAAREGVFHGIPGIAVSTHLDMSTHDHGHIEYDTAAVFIKEILEKGVLDLMSPLHVINVNVPNCSRDMIKGVKLCELSFRKYSETILKKSDLRGRDYYWVGGKYEGYIGDEKTDCFAVENNYISVSVLNLMGRPADNLNTWNEFLKQF